ncbi:Hypp4713 [Branchiostoma lanceolatum]|uniref:Hypp4713 protein n=1 Tax=Branchiostoma lanceolatum TaxID=7740 RepID=A0A8K0F2I9_BRALA|nr:Hypp4713 [Branchiostoma lanceolatum]
MDLTTSKRAEVFDTRVPYIDIGHPVVCFCQVMTSRAEQVSHAGLVGYIDPKLSRLASNNKFAVRIKLSWISPFLRLGDLIGQGDCRRCADIEGLSGGIASS